MNNTVLQLEGYTNDLLMVGSPDGSTSMKSTRLIQLDPENRNLDYELVDIAITSTNRKDEHPIFSQLLDKKIRITVETIED